MYRFFMLQLSILFWLNFLFLSCQNAALVFRLGSGTVWLKKPPFLLPRSRVEMGRLTMKMPGFWLPQETLEMSPGVRKDILRCEL